MSARAVICVICVLIALTACSSGTNGHLVPGPGAAASASTGGGATVSKDAGTAESSASASGGSDPGVAGSGPAAFCSKLKTAESQLANISAGASDLAGLKSVVAQEIAAFRSLENGAPTDVRPAIEDLVKVLTAAETAFSDPSHADPSALQGLTANLPKDAQTIGEYVGTKCVGG